MNLKRQTELIDVVQATARLLKAEGEKKKKKSKTNI